MTHDRSENARQQMIHRAWDWVRQGIREHDVSRVISARLIFESLGVEKGIQAAQEVIDELTPQKVTA